MNYYLIEFNDGTKIGDWAAGKMEAVKSAWSKYLYNSPIKSVKENSKEVGVSGISDYISRPPRKTRSFD